MNNEKINILIEKYFEGSATVSEERLLLKTLLEMPQDEPLIKETLAVMGYSSMIPRKEKKRRLALLTPGFAAAVVIGLVFGLGVVLNLRNVDTPVGECFAYVGGNRIESEAVVEGLVESDLRDMAIASKEVDHQINIDMGEFRGMFNLQNQ